MADDLFELSGKVAIVTGGSRGLGREMVLAFAARGADVVIASRKLENCEAVAADVRAMGRRALPIAYHAASWSDADRLAEEIQSNCGTLVGLTARCLPAMRSRGRGTSVGLSSR